MSENTNVAGVDVAKKYKKKSQTADIVKRLFRNKSAVLGMIIFLCIIVIALSADFLFDYEQDVIKQHIMNRLQGPSSEHWFGTDEMGRDIFARVLYGAKYSLKIGFSASIVSLAIGLVIGAVAGYYGGWIDMVVMRIMDVLLAIPGFAGWIAPYFVFRSQERRKEKAVQPLIEEKIEEIYQLCEKGHNLL